MSANWRTGEAHPKAQASDEIVRFMRALRERHGWPYHRIGNYTQIPWVTVRSIVTYRTRISAGHPDGIDISRANYADKEFHTCSTWNLMYKQLGYITSNFR